LRASVKVTIVDFFREYFEYVGESEAPTAFHRWCALSVLATTIGREVWIPFGHSPIYPNQYILLLGVPGSRKSSAIGIAKKVLRLSGYTAFAKDRTSKERFFSDMARTIDFDEEGLDIEALVLDSPSEITIANGEFLDFIGRGDMDFLTALTNLWDCLAKYEHPKLHGKDVIIQRPTVNILGGATVKGLGMAIPAEALGTGILSRLMLIHADATTRKITFPPPVPDSKADRLVQRLKQIKSDMKGEMIIGEETRELFDRMYKNCPGIPDARFADYMGRRFIHLLKLSMLFALADLRMEITSRDALSANTVLSCAEREMPKGLGEFGQSKYSDVTNTIVETLGKSSLPISHAELWKLVSKDLNDVKDLINIMKNLITSEKVQVLEIGGKKGYMPKTLIDKHWEEDLILPSILVGDEFI